MIFRPFSKQKEILRDESRIIGAFCGKRSGKTEVGAIKTSMWQEQKPNGHLNGNDPFIGVIMAPTNDMLSRLSLSKFMLYAKPMIKSYVKNPHVITWHDGSIVYGLSADKPERIEGIKANWIWLDEVLQMKEQLFLECKARTADTKGYILATGSLGVQFINPKMHWAYTYFKERPDKNTSVYEWNSLDNPYMPAEEIESLRDTLDPKTFRAMFEINWDTIPKNAVYDTFSEDNIMPSLSYNPNLETYVSIDWGWTHPMACGFFQYDRARETVYLFDEIVESKMTIEKLFNKIMAKPYRIHGFCCDVAGNQEREQIGKSNIQWFREKGIKFRHRRTAITYGIPIVRQFIKDGRSRNRFYISSQCVKSIDGMKQYRYNERDGIILNENPVKENDDAVDMIRYFFVNYMDKNLEKPKAAMLPR